MSRFIRDKGLSLFKGNARRQARYVPGRRLNFECLEGREMLSTTTGILNGSFESPALAAQTFQYAPGLAVWQFSTGAGVASNGSAFGNPAAPDGSQVAFLQASGSVTESVYLNAGTYSLSFQAAQRTGQTQEIEVLIDGKEIGTATPTSNAFGTYQLPEFTAAAGTHTVKLEGLNPKGGDNTAFVDEVAITAAQDMIVDGSFGAPSLPANAYLYTPSGSSWQFSTGAGVASNGSAFGNPAAPNGSQVAFLQATGSVTESVYLDAGTYSLTFQAAERASQSQELEVLIDGKEIGTATPTSNAFGTYQLPVFTVAAGTHTVKIEGLNPKGGDNTAFVDEVAITAAEDMIVDGSFGAPSLPANAYLYTPNGSSWQFSTGAGVASNGSAFGNPAAPSGSQVAFLQATGSVTESVYLDAGTYSLSFQAAERAGQTQEIKVLIDGATVGEATPTATTFATYDTPLFTVKAGMHTVELLGVNPNGGDNTAFVDEVQLS